MSHLEQELNKLKTDIVEMWTLVINQLVKSKDALQNFDKAITGEVLANEKRVDAFELKLNMDCENILALFNPLANDLRFVLAVLKINYNLERIGDYAKGVAKIIKHMDVPFDNKSLEVTQIREMYEVSIEMLTIALNAFENENNEDARSIFRKDEALDSINKGANKTIAGLIAQNPDNTLSMLDLLSIIRKLERVGDQTKNISEETIFYLEAKLIRHQKHKAKKGDQPKD